MRVWNNSLYALDNIVKQINKAITSHNLLVQVWKSHTKEYWLGSLGPELTEELEKQTYIESLEWDIDWPPKNEE